MNLRKHLRKANIFMDLQAGTKEEIIREMVDRLVRVEKIDDREAVLEAVLERERKMSTGLENGIAIPHGKTDAVREMSAAVAIRREGADFDSLDGRPARIFVMTVSPASRSGPHIQFLAEIGRLLGDPGLRESLLEARRAEDVLRLLTGRP